MSHRRLCPHCRRVARTSVMGKVCYDCARVIGVIKRAAHHAVNRAVAKGLLPPCATLKCVDCGDRAKDYDHRDYLNPMAVQATCHPCNLKRGSTITEVEHFHFADELPLVDAWLADSHVAYRALASQP